MAHHDEDDPGELDPDRVVVAIADQFPALAGLPVTRLGAGDDHEAFGVGDEWVVRVARRAEQAAWLAREREILTLAREALGSAAPRIELVGRPSQALPFPFAGHRRLVGIGADALARGPSVELAGDLGRALRSLHRIDPARVPPAPGPALLYRPERVAAEIVDAAGRIAPLLDPELCRRAEPYLTGARPVPPRDAPRRFIHNDMSPEHVIVDRRRGRLVGLIDFADATVGDPVIDFVGLIGLGGWPFIARVVAHYDLALGAGWADRLSWLVRVLTLRWLAIVAVRDPARVPVHREWVRHALADPDALPVP